VPDSSQTFSITETTRPRWVLKTLILAAVLLPLAWSIGVREWDSYAAYSGVVVEKGMGCGVLCWFGRHHNADLYVILEDGQGHRSKRYVGTTRSAYSSVSWWNNVAVGASVVKNKGYGEVPRELGTNPPMRSQQSSLSGGWISLIILACGGLLFVDLRRLWNAIQN
jgi:hypothetical protein